MSVPPTPTAAEKPARQSFVPLVSVVDFHHARGPEVERWFGVEDGRDPAAEYDWTLLPFMALSDGAHALTEDFSYFTLLRPATDTAPATSLFGISCTRQMDAAQLLHRPADVTRSTVQKAVVVIADSPQYFGVLRERLSVVTQAWFAQREFADVEILRRFQESLADEKARGLMHEDEDRDQYLGLSLRELVREFRWQTLVLLKCCLLQPKMLFFGTRCERLCLTQFSLVSLIPGLLRNLQDSAGPELDSYQRSLTRPTSLRTSDRNSLLSYMGLPLQIFGKGSLFGPYTPLQQLDVLADFGTKSYIVGSTNSLLLQQKDRYSDILINLDEGSINITSPSLKAALQLSTPDRRWIDFITQNVNDTWDDANPSRPKTMGYVGSEEFIRVQFEEYLLSLLSSVKYQAHLAKHANNPRMLLPDIDGDPSHDYGSDFVDAWSRTENFRIWNTHTDSHLFDIVEPRHPCAGGLTIDDIQRRITQQVQDLHWDERFAQGKEVLGRNLAAGREKASTLFNKLYADMEALREAQRKRNEEARAQQQQQQLPQSQPSPQPGEQQQQQQKQSGGEKSPTSTGTDPASAQRTAQTVGSKAGAFVNSWAAWAGEKRRAAWGRSTSSPAPDSAAGNNRNSIGAASVGGGDTTNPSGNATGNGNRSGRGGWAASWGRSSSGTGGNKSRASLVSFATVGGYEAVSLGRDDGGEEDGAGDGARRLSMMSDASKRTTGEYSDHVRQGLLDGFGGGGGERRAPVAIAAPGGMKDGGDEGAGNARVTTPVVAGPAVNGDGKGKGDGNDNDDDDEDGKGTAGTGNRSENGNRDGDGAAKTVSGLRDGAAAEDGDPDENAASGTPSAPSPPLSPPVGASDVLAAEAAQAREAWDSR